MARRPVAWMQQEAEKLHPLCEDTCSHCTHSSPCHFHDIRSSRCCCASCRPPLPMPGGYLHHIHRHRMIPPFGPGSSEPPTHRPQMPPAAIESSSEATSSIRFGEIMSIYSSKNRPTGHAPHHSPTPPLPFYYCTASPIPPTNLTFSTVIIAS